MILNGPTLIFAAHPDDEILGCGATIARLTDSGNKVKTIFMSDGESSRVNTLKQKTLDSMIALRKEVAIEVAGYLDCEEPTFYDFPDNKLDIIPLLEIAKIIEYEIEKFKPVNIFTHFYGDLNIDHRQVAIAVATATRPKEESILNAVCSFEIPSSTEWNQGTGLMTFTPNLYVDIENYVDKKLRALSLYKNEMRKFPHPRSEQAIMSLMNWRGSNSGFRLAEAFQINKAVIH